MKKIKKIFLMIPAILLVISMMNTVYASSLASISISPTSPQKGKPVTITVTVSRVNTVDLTAKVSGAGTSGTIRLVDGSMTGSEKSFSSSITVTPTTTGTINVTISSSSNAVRAGQYVDVSGSKSVTVKAASTSNNTGGSTGGSSGGSTSGNTGGSSSGSTGGSSSGSSGGSTTTDNRSKENNLQSLSVSSGTLSPSFSASTTSYKVDLTSDITKLTINAKAKDSKAKVSGTGEKELKIGENNFVVAVVAENGSKKTYTISAYVTEKATQFVKFSDKDYGVLSDFSKANLPKGFAPTTLQVDGKNVTGLKNETIDLTLLYLQDTEGKTGFYIYEDGAVIGEYKTVTINQKVYIILNDKTGIKDVNGIKEGTVKIGDLELQGWLFDDKKLSNYSLVYLMNDAGEKGLYSYESTEGTLQKYVSTTPVSDNTMTYVLIGTTALFAITTIVSLAFYMNFKKKSIASIKDYYDNKNQG